MAAVGRRREQEIAEQGIDCLAVLDGSGVLDGFAATKADGAVPHVTGPALARPRTVDG